MEDTVNTISTRLWRSLAAAVAFLILGPGALVPVQHLAAQEDNTVYLPLVTTAPPPLDSLQLAFFTDRDGEFQIYTMQADGSSVTQLTDTAWFKGGLSWSPDGQKILFGANPSDPVMNWDIYAMQSDGTSVINLTNNPASDGGAVWSPDGSKIAFESDRDGNNEIYVMNSDGSTQRNLTNDPGSDEEPTWSPDGAQIAFVSIRSGEPGLYVMQADGSNQVRLTDATPARRPAWSPDGQSIAYAFDSNLYVLNLNTLTSIKLTDHASGFLSVIGNLEWSPDGAQLAYSHCICVLPSSTPNIYLILADGSEDTPRMIGQGGYPTWSPDGGYLAYNTRSYAIVGLTAQIYVRVVRTGENLQLTTGANNYSAVWRPINTRGAS